MKTLRNKSGYSLVELLVVMSIVGLLAGIGLTTVKGVLKSFESSDRVRGMVSAALSNARVMAIAKGKYAGVRFQRNADGQQYMIFIEQDSGVGPGDVLLSGMAGFRAVTGRNPIRLPSGGSVMDLKVKTDYTILNSYTTEIDVISDLHIDQDSKLLDAEIFSVVFDKTGKLVFCHLRVGFTATDGGDIFNTSATGTGMFLEDECDSVADVFVVEGLQLELSRNNFVIVDRNEFDSVPAGERWSKYLQYLKPVYINPYTGELID